MQWLWGGVGFSHRDKQEGKFRVSKDWVQEWDQINLMETIPAVPTRRAMVMENRRTTLLTEVQSNRRPIGW